MDLGIIKKSKIFYRIKGQDFCKSWLWNVPKFNLQSAYFDLWLLADENGNVQARLDHLRRRWRVTYQTAFVWLASLAAHDYIAFAYDEETRLYSIALRGPGNTTR